MLWWIMEPTIFALLFYIAFSSGVKDGANSGNQFVYFLLVGLFPFKWTASAITGSSNSLISNKGILGQAYLPKWVFPAVCNLTALIRFAFIFPLLLVALALGGYEPGIDWFSVIYIVICQLIFNLSISFLLSALVPLIPDLVHIIPIVVTAMMFTSGIFFDVSDRPESIQDILYLNPMVSILDGYRSVLLDGVGAKVDSLAYPFFISLVLCVFGITLLKYFDRYYPRTLV
jgi:lipopolysaccharide transport system permease protein